ncbi:MAG: hypothetical protein ACLSUM_00740 [Dysosmobacter welbionis]
MRGISFDVNQARCWASGESGSGKTSPACPSWLLQHPGRVVDGDFFQDQDILSWKRRMRRCAARRLPDLQDPMTPQPVYAVGNRSWDAPGA